MKDCVYTGQSLARMVHKHGLPVEIAAGGSGQTAYISNTFEVAYKCRKILGTALVMGMGVVIRDSK